MTGAQEVADVAEVPVALQVEQRRRRQWLALMVLLAAARHGRRRVDGEPVTFDAPVDLGNSSMPRVLLPTRVAAREMKGSPDALSPAALEHRSGAPTATPAQAGTR